MDKIWSLTSALTETLLTLAAYNLLKTKPSDKSVCQGFSLLPYPPTVKSLHYAIIGTMDKCFSYRTPANDSDLSTIVFKVREKTMDNAENFIFPLGELYVVFSTLKVIGKYISESGIDRIFVKAGLDASSTLGQIMENI